MRTKYVLTILSLAVAAASLHAETFACDLKALTPEQRMLQKKLNKELKTSVTAVRELPDGYALEIDSSKLPIVDIAQWVTLEHRCCPFVLFRLDVQRRDNIVTLSLQGPVGVKPFLETEFHLGK
jgi:hypothetical protein